MMIFYFYLACFTFPVSYSVLLFNSVYVLQFLLLFLFCFWFFFFLDVLSKAFNKYSRKAFVYIPVSSVQSFSHVWLFVTPWTAACQAFLSIASFQSLLKLMSIKSVMPSSHLILCHPLLLLPSISILGTYLPGEFIFQFIFHIFLPFHTVHGGLKARILK